MLPGHLERERCAAAAFVLLRIPTACAALAATDRITASALCLVPAAVAMGESGSREDGAAGAGRRQKKDSVAALQCSRARVCTARTWRQRAALVRLVFRYLRTGAPQGRVLSPVVLNFGYPLFFSHPLTHSFLFRGLRNKLCLFVLGKSGSDANRSQPALLISCIARVLIGHQSSACVLIRTRSRWSCFCIDFHIWLAHGEYRLISE